MEKEPRSEASKEEKADTSPPPPPPSPKPESSEPPDRGSETLAAPNSGGASAGAGRSFFQLLAGAMASPAGSPRTAPILTVPVVAVPCFLAPTALLESSGFTGQFTMSHQAVLATVTAQAQMHLQAAYPSSSEIVANSFPQPVLSTISTVPLHQRPLSLPEDNVCTPEAEAEQPPSSDQKLQSTQIVVKAISTDAYNWRKYGQKQVKSSERSRSYYKCTNADCLAKKKVERCPDGRETEIIYRGQHNHDPPRKASCSKESRAQSGGPSVENESLDLPSSELKVSDPLTSKTEQNSGNETPKQQLYCSSDCEGDVAIKSVEDPGDEPDPKRRLSENTMAYLTPVTPVLKRVKEPKIVVQTACDVGSLTDGYRWRKYGQKIVKGNPNPRSYYRCTQSGCPVRKHVERAPDDANSLVITYEGKHNHRKPKPKSGSDTPTTALPIAAAAAAAVTKGEQLHTADSLLDQKPSIESPMNVDGKLTGAKALELGGDKALESAETLLSIGTNSDGVKHPLFNENRAAVPVQNS